jgi:hypothetical protein
MLQAGVAALGACPLLLACAPKFEDHEGTATTHQAASVTNVLQGTATCADIGLAGDASATFGGGPAGFGIFQTEAAFVNDHLVITIPLGGNADATLSEANTSFPAAPFDFSSTIPLDAVIVTGFDPAGNVVLSNVYAYLPPVTTDTGLLAPGSEVCNPDPDIGCDTPAPTGVTLCFQAPQADGGCTPTPCAAIGANCGSMPDGCGGTLDCGSCTGGLTCGGAGTGNVCGTNCVPSTCPQGAACGVIPDGCGGTLDCGPCPDAGSCTSTTCAAAGANCGAIADGCGGTLDCGSCTAPQTCGGGGTANVCGTSADAGSCTPTG